MADEPAPQAPRLAQPRLAWRPLRWIASAAVLLALAAAGGLWFLGTPLALEMLRARAVAAGNGRLTIDGAEGSLLSAVRVARMAWHGDDVEVEATEVALAWHPFDLLGKRFNVDSLRAQHLAVTLKGAGETALPGDLALPFEVDLRDVRVQQLELASGTARLALDGIGFRYRGGGDRHEMSDLRFVTALGTLAGNASIGAAAPFPVAAALTFAGDDRLRGAASHADVAGTLARLTVDAKGTLREAQATARATLAPLAAVMLVDVRVDARNVDLASMVAALPGTRVDLTVDAKPAGSGISGTLSARNTTPGTIDAGRAPLSSIAARFAYDGREIALDDIAAALGREGRVSGSATIPVDGAHSRWTLAVQNLDLAGLHTALVTTRLSGSIRADVAQARQVVRAELAQADMALRFDATVDGRAVDVAALAARAGASEVTGRGRIALDGTRPFEFMGQLQHVDPSRFGAFPAGDLTGTIAASGTLAPTWQIGGDLAVKSGSRLEHTPIAGTLHGKFTRESVADALLDLHLGSATLTAQGAFGTPGSQLAFKSQVPDLATIEPWLARMAPGRLPGPLSGKLGVEGTLTSGAGLPGFAVTIHAAGLAAGTTWRIGTLDGAASLEAATGSLALASRKIALGVGATKIATPAATFASASVEGAGSLDRHALKLAAAGDGFATTAELDGSLAVPAAGGSDYQWTGTIGKLVNEGSFPAHLIAPATLTVARGRVRVSATQVAIADGAAQLDEFQWTAGRVDTSGRFKGVPLGALARLARVKLPMPSTLTLGGEWALHAEPRLNGTLNIHREEGDLYIAESQALATESPGFGITELVLEARWIDDAIDANARFRSTRAGTADGTLQIAAVPGTEPLFLSTRAPLTATFAAELPTLRVLQPLLGTAGVADGHVRANVAVAGSLASPVLTGTLTGDALRLDFPQYGMHFVDGKLRASLGDGKVALDELSFAGGEGRFTANGVVALPTRGAPAAGADSKITWQATRLRMTNRPDLRLVGTGNGTLKLAERRLVLAGKLAIDSGHIEYRRTVDGQLGSDVVIVGEPRREPPRGLGEDLPLFLDLDLALGQDLAFDGEGFAANLTGQLHLLTLPTGIINATGTIQSVNGTYFAFGQRLTVDRGRVIFDGPLNNPGLDIVALRKNAQVEAGVEITGTLRIPVVRLTSNPPVPDNEKLSWLLTGQGLDRASGNDIAAISAASLSLLTNDQRPITTRIAQSVGLDDISVRSSSAARATGSVATQVVAFGKRITDRLTLVYEQGLTVATNALRIEYALTRNLTLRAEAGVVSTIGVVYRRTYD